MTAHGSASESLGTPHPATSAPDAHEVQGDPTERLPDMCRRGLHRLEGENVRYKVNPGGHLARQCKPCYVAAQKRWRIKNRERYNASVRRKRNEPGPARDRRLAAARQWAAEHRVRDELTRCRRGHPQDAATCYVRPDGRRECRACRRGYQAAYRARKREG